MKNKVFITYNHSGEVKNAIHDISDQLENMGLSVWLDEQEIKAGDSISEAIKKALDESSYVIAVVGPNDKNSKWVSKELEFAISEGKRIIPVIASDATVNDLPEIISDYMAVDISNNKNNLIKVYESIDRDRSVWSKIKEYIVNG